ncbi:MAG: ABC transporter ATP-binding protein [Tissierella sp.]|nr:ABC transporter ATP-binding protein [Tissierella sp.]
MLNVKDLNTYYGAIHALKGVSIQVNEGEIVSLIGSNGAGKSTLVNTIAGLLKPRSGSIEFEGKSIFRMEAYNLLKEGISLSPEGREVFGSLTVEENLKLGAYIIKDPKQINDSFEYVYELFPKLKERKGQYAGTLSGGEQQMLAIARSLMGRPKLLLLDEPSLGLAPNIVSQIFELIQQISKEGITILLIEQNAFMALKTSDRAYVLENGVVSLEGPSKDIINDDKVREIYLGI